MRNNLLFFTLFFAVVCCHADTVVMKNGHRFECEVEGETEDSYGIVTEKKFIHIPKSEVERIEFSGNPEPTGVDWKAIGITAGGIAIAAVLFLLVRAGASY